MDRVKKAVEKNRGLILEAFDWIWRHPETGYREWKTSEYLAGKIRELGYTVTMAGDIPGFYADIDTGRPGPTVGVFGELDALLCPEHPEADPETGAVHACGHCCQTAALLGLAAAFAEPEMRKGLWGRIRLLAVPAEELIEAEYREELRRRQVIRHFGGKVEFMHRGFLDNVDMALMIHTSTGLKSMEGRIVGGSNGLITKLAYFTGAAAHAGAEPHAGINALYAANLGLNAINALRETFPDEFKVRVHPIIKSGGSSVNTIPDLVVVENNIRALELKIIENVNKRVNRAMAASAAAMGAKVRLCDRPGYSPRKNEPGMMALMKEAMEAVLPRVYYDPHRFGAGCSDMGDVSCVMPTVHPYIGGAGGTGHGSTYRIVDPETACVASASVQAVFLRLLLENRAARAYEIRKSFRPEYASIREYLEVTERLSLDVDAVVYHKDGSVTLRTE